MLNTMLVDLAGENGHDKANALFIGFFTGGGLIFAVLFGFLIDYSHTYLAAFNTCAASYIAGSILVLIFITDKRS